MILINRKTKQAYSNVSRAKAARMVHIGSQSIKRWQKEAEEIGCNEKIFNSWAIYFNQTTCKQRKGFALKPSFMSYKLHKK